MLVGGFGQVSIYFATRGMNGEPINRQKKIWKVPSAEIQCVEVWEHAHSHYSTSVILFMTEPELWPAETDSITADVCCSRNKFRYTDLPFAAGPRAFNEITNNFFLTRRRPQKAFFFPKYFMNV